MKESDIRPAEVFNEYLRLSALDAESYFPVEGRQAIPCVACRSQRLASAFTKSGFDYQECLECGTLFQSPRPSLQQYVRFYEGSPSSEYWAKVFFPSLAEKRRALMFAPRARKISQLCNERGIAVDSVLDVGAGYGIFLEEWKRLHPESRTFAVEPGAELAAVCREKGIEVLEAVAENAGAWAGKAGLAVCFEVIEHVHQPLTFVQALRNLVRPGGWAIVSGLGVDGFDIQTLWEKSKSVSPPHHINFMSVNGFECLFEQAGFDEIRVTTPGVLDVDIVRNHAREDESALAHHRFERALLSRGPEACAAFQSFLSKHRLSSHVWVLARRPPTDG